MFHTLSELQEKEKKLKNGQNIDNGSNILFKKNKSPEDNYYGKGNKAYDHYNKRSSTESNEENFEKTKNKIQLVVFQNGFILNNGPFRDRSIPANNKFMEEVERGVIPHEFIEKGYNDLGILLINRRSEFYNPVPTITPITQITQITQINPINPVNVNPISSYDNFNSLDNFNSINNFNPINNINPINHVNQINNINNYHQYGRIEPVDNYNQHRNINPLDLFGNYNLGIDNQYPFQYQNTYSVHPNKYGYTVVPVNRKSGISPYMPMSPVGTRNVRNNIILPNTVSRNDYSRIDRNTSSVQRREIDMDNFNKKKSTKKFRTFESLKKMEFMKEEEEKKKKKEAQKIQSTKEPRDNERKEKEEEKKFKPFGGTGQIVGLVNIEGLNVNTNVKNVVDIYRPVCTINVRLFNGEIVKCEFNYSQTIRDIYYYVRRISGSNNFTLLDGFPPKPLRDYDKTIGSMRLENCTLTQRLNA